VRQHFFEVAADHRRRHGEADAGAIKDAAPDSVADDLIKRARKGLQDYLEAQLRRERRARSRRTTIVVSSEAAASEIVSGEISGGGEPTPSETGMNEPRSESAEPTRRFAPAEAAPASVPMPAAEPAKPAAPIERDPDAPRPGLEIDLFSTPHTAAPPLSELLKDKNSDDSKPRIDSVAAALSSEVPAVPAAPPSLIVPDIGHTPLPVAPPIIGAPRVGGTMPFTPGPAPDPKPASEKPAAPAAPPPAPAPRATSLFMPGPVTPPVAAPEAKPDSDAPVMRRRQTLLGVLPTNEPSKPPAPSLPSLNNVGAPPAAGAPFAPAMPRTGLPTRGTTRLDLPAIGSTPPNPAGPAPVFRAPPTPNAPKSDEKK
jgi:hypothetical protein